MELDLLTGNILGNIGNVFHNKGDLDAAMEKFKQSLKISEDIGEKEGIATSFHNLGAVYFETKNYHRSLEHLLKSIALKSQVEMKTAKPENYIWRIRKKMGLHKFQSLASEVIQKLPEKVRKYIKMEKFMEDKTVRQGPRVGINDPCPCNSGKKYKKCCSSSDH